MNCHLLDFLISCYARKQGMFNVVTKSRSFLSSIYPTDIGRLVGLPHHDHDILEVTMKAL